MLVTVVTPFYNGDRAEYFRSCLRSIEESRYRPLEVILIQDGPVRCELESLVNTFEARNANSLGFFVKKIKLERNLGPAAARNRGIEAATGEFIAILDADDEILENRIESQVQFLVRNVDVAIVGMAYICIDENGAEIGRVKMPVGLNKIKWTSTFINPMSNPTILGRASVLKKHRYPEFLRYGEDYWLWVELLRRNYNLENIGEFGIRFRAPLGFEKKRKGIKWAKSDFNNRIRTLTYQNFVVRVFALLYIPMFSLFRLMPDFVINLAYKLRRILH